MRQALVTGATGGVGLEVLRLLGALDWDVMGIHRGHADRAAAARRTWTGPEDTLDLRACDLSDSEAVAALHASLSADYCPDVLVHLAAPPFRVQPLHKTAWSEFDGQMGGVLKPVVEITQPLLRRMVRRGHGRIVTVLSMVVLGDPPRGFGSYTAAKYALAGYMRCLATEYAGRGISANCVSPGPMNTAQLSELPDMLREQMRTSTAGGDWIDPAAVARTVVWLATEASPEINGCNVPLTAAAPRTA